MVNKLILSVAICSVALSSTASAQKNTYIHPLQAELKLPGLLRRIPMKLASYSVELHPGWMITETYDSAQAVTAVRCSNPHDSTKEFATIISHPVYYTNLDTNTWENMVGTLRAGYGDRGIGTLVLLDTVFNHRSRSNDQLSRCEILANRQDALEYAAIVMTPSESILLTAILPNVDYESRLAYIRSIAGSIEGLQTH